GGRKGLATKGHPRGRPCLPTSRYVKNANGGAATAVRTITCNLGTLRKSRIQQDLDTFEEVGDNLWWVGHAAYTTWSIDAMELANADSGQCGAGITDCRARMCQ